MMKVLISLLLVCALLTGCTFQTTESANPTEMVTEATAVTANEEVDFSELSDPKLLEYVKENVYSDVIAQLNSENYFVENVNAIYISKEYIDEIAYNSQSNIYFGYTLAQIDEAFNGSRYVFTLGEDGKTTVQEFEKYDDSYEQMIKNVAVGSGVILVYVTVSLVTNAVGASAVSLVFAASAKTGTAFALSDGLFSGVTAGVIEGIQTKNFNSAIKTAALEGSKGFKWGAIVGGITGGAEGLSKLKALNDAIEFNGLTLNQAAKIQMDTKWTSNTIRQLKSIDEYGVYKKANLKEVNIDGQVLLLKNDLDLNFKSELEGKEVTNLERMLKGNSPIDPSTGKSYHLHHIGQKSDGTLAMLTEKEHLGNASILNTPGKTTEIDRKTFNSFKNKFYPKLAEYLS